MFQSTLKLDSSLFNAAERARAFNQIPHQAAQTFRQNLKQKMIDSTPAGRTETIGRGAGFRATFRRSKRGQRPAIQTRKLINSIYARRTGDNSAQTLVTAEYAEQLQKNLGRLVMTSQDVAEAEKDFIERGKRAILDLLS